MIRKTTVTLCIALLAATLFWWLLDSPKKRGKTTASSSRSRYPHLQVHSAQRSTHPVYVTAFGTAEAAKTVLLKAAINGKIESGLDVYTGMDLQAGQVIFSIEKTKLRLEKERLQAEIALFQAQEETLQAEQKYLQQRLVTGHDLLQLNEASLEKNRARLAIEQEVFRKREELLSRDAISNVEFLQEKSRLHTLELDSLNGEKQLQQQRDILANLAFQLKSNSLQQKELQQRQRQQHLRIAEVEEDLRKAEVQVDFPARVVDVLADIGEEVSQGSPLLKVRSIESIEIPLNIPDMYFPWVYQGPLFAHLAKERKKDIAIRLVNQAYEKTFAEGYIQSIGERVNIPTRSLPITVRRETPLDEEGHPIFSEELLPGMYCEVRLHLADAEETFLIPRQAIHQHNSLFYAQEKGGNYTLEELKDIEILLETDEGTLVRIPHAPETLLVAVQKPAFLRAGMPIHIQIKAKKE